MIKKNLVASSFVFKLFKEMGMANKFMFAVYIFSFSISLFYCFTSILIPYLFKELSSQLAFSNQGYTIASVTSIAAAYCLVWVIAQVSEQLREIVIAPSLHKAVSKVIRDIYYKKLKNQSVDPNPTGNQIALFSIFQEYFPNFVTSFFYYLIPLLIQLFLVSIILGIQCGVWYSAIFINVLMLLFVITYTRIRRFIILQEEALNANLLLFDHLTDRYANFETVMLFANRKNEMKLLSNLLGDAEEKQIKSRIHLEITRLFQGLIFGLALVCVTYLSVYDIAKDQGMFTDFLMLNAYILQIVSPLSALSFILTDLSRGILTLERFLLDTADQLSNKKEAIHSVKTKILNPINTIEFCNVSYSYEKSQIIIKNVSFKIHDMKTIFLIGESGSGKSTLSKLLCFLYEFQQGQVLLNGICSTNYDVEELRTQFSIVPQSIQLFNDTLLNNLLYANSSASVEQIDEALYISALSEWVKSLKDGLNTKLEEFGKNVSGGQRQRIALARALLKNSSVLILDEFTSHLDTLTVIKIHERLKRLKPHLMIFFITHQIEILNSTDYIILLRNGSIHAQGTHNELLANNFWYKNMIKSSDELMRKKQ